MLGGSPRLVLGVYTVTPALGLIPAGQCQTITVDCLTGDKPGRHEEVDTECLSSYSVAAVSKTILLAHVIAGVSGGDQ